MGEPSLGLNRFWNGRLEITVLLGSQSGWTQGQLILADYVYIASDDLDFSMRNLLTFS